MNPELFLDLTNYHSNTQWRWVLTDANGHFLADHEVDLDPDESVYRGFVDLPGYLNYYTPARSETLLLNDLGRWMGEQVFGGIAGKLLAYEQKPARVVGIRVPPEAQDLLFRPYELAHLEGRPLAARGFRFIYSLTPRAPLTPGPSPKWERGVREALRFLAVFSLPHGASPLNLRRERFQIKRLLDTIAQTRGLAVDLRVIQYGATRQTLANALEESPGWDVIHFSGHGLEGELILEKPDGRIDRVTTAELIPMLAPAKARLKLLTLSACLSGAADLQQARAQIGLENPPTRVTHLPDTAPAAESGYTVLPSLAQRLASELDCAALAMRYPVIDTFATDLVLCLYRGLLEKKQPLPGALQLAIEAALHIDKAPQRAGFSMIIPILFGERAAGLRLLAPTRRPSFESEPTSLFNLTTEPPRFVGRLLPMLRASQALAPESDKTGVLFYGMAGSGKTSCALELAYSHEKLERFTAFVWHKAPEEGRDIQAALTRLALDMETQLPGLKLVGLVDDPQAYESRALPQLRRLMEQNAILIVIDNLEGLLTSEGGWRDSRWGRLVAALLRHSGPSRLVLTSRRMPASLKGHPKLRPEAIHALSFRESVVLARELPNLRPLFDDPAGRELLQRVLRAVQGHPKLLELADRQAADRAALEARLRQAEGETHVPAVTTLAAFFDKGESAQGEADFVAELHRWTNGLAATLTPTARLLFHFLARLEDEDRTVQVIKANWEYFLRRLTGERVGESTSQRISESAREAAAGALEEGGPGLADALELLVRTGLIEAVAPVQSPETTPPELQTLLDTLPAQDPHLQSLIFNLQSSISNYRLHPGVAEAALSAAAPATMAAVDWEVGNYFGAIYQQGIKTEMQGGGGLVVAGARRAAPYLLRAERWQEAATLLERMIQRDTSPVSLALALPLLRWIVTETEGSELGLGVAGVLANALMETSRYPEAENTLRVVIDKCVAQGNFRLASANAGNLLNLLMDTGRYEAALVVAAEMSAYTHQAGLGPWTQLTAEGMRLQILNALGRYAEVLAEVEGLRKRMAKLPEASEQAETANPWNVRETLLDTGGEAAVRSQQWETALALNAESVKSKQARGADEVEIARTRYNDYGPLLRLNRYPQARVLLEYCREVYEGAGAIHEAGAAYTALADLEAELGNHAAAARFEESALRYSYQAGQPEDCAISHNNLAGYLERSGGAPETVIAHGLAAVMVNFQTNSGHLTNHLRNLASSALPAAPPTFEQVCTAVEQIEGVRFGELFARLPQRAPDGEAAIAAVWKMALEHKAEEKNRWEPRLQAIAAVAQGEEGQRAEVEATLVSLEGNGWMLHAPVQRIWDGERDADTLTEGLDEQDSALVRRVLELLGAGKG